MVFKEKFCSIAEKVEKSSEMRLKLEIRGSAVLYGLCCSHVVNQLRTVDSWQRHILAETKSSWRDVCCLIPYIRRKYKSVRSFRLYHDRKYYPGCHFLACSYIQYQEMFICHHLLKFYMANLSKASTLGEEIGCFERKVACYSWISDCLFQFECYI